MPGLFVVNLEDRKVTLKLSQKLLLQASVISCNPRSILINLMLNRLFQIQRGWKLMMFYIKLNLTTMTIGWFLCICQEPKDVRLKDAKGKRCSHVVNAKIISPWTETYVFWYMVGNEWECNVFIELYRCTFNIKYVRRLTPEVIGKQFVYCYLEKKNVIEKKQFFFFTINAQCPVNWTKIILGLGSNLVNNNIIPWS